MLQVILSVAQVDELSAVLFLTNVQTFLETRQAKMYTPQPLRLNFLLVLY